MRLTPILLVCAIWSAAWGQGKLAQDTRGAVPRMLSESQGDDVKGELEDAIPVFWPNGQVTMRAAEEESEGPHRVFVCQNWQGVYPEVQDGDIFENCNLQGPEAFLPSESHTLFPDARKMVFRGCNLLNVDLPDDAILEGPNLANVHVYWQARVTMSPSEWQGRQAVQSQAEVNAQAQVDSEPVAAGLTVAEARQAAETRKGEIVQNMTAPMRTVDDVLDLGYKKIPITFDLSILTPKPNADGSVTFCKQVVEGHEE